MTEPTVNEEQSPLTKPKFIISAVVVAIIVALGIILALVPKGGGTPPPEPSSAAPSAGSNQPSGTSTASVCGLPPGDQAKPATAPTTKWELVGKIAAPTSPKQFGPGKTEANGLRSCFAHSPTGALYAGANMIILGSSGRPAILAQRLVVEGPERDKMLAEPPMSAPARAPFQLAGYKILEYTGDRAVVEYGITASNGSVGSVPVAMQWQDGDWKWVLPATGQPEARQLSDLNSFISWAGV